jgi:transposase-like protein
MGKRRRYTDEERATLVAMLIAEGYPDKKGALSKVATYAQLPPSTLQRWFHGTNNPPPTQLANEKVFDLKEALQTELQAILKTMPSARADAEYGDLSRALGIITDKLLLLDKQPTERIAVEHSGQISIDERRQRINELLNQDGNLRRFIGASATDD